jgi:hypothetical protein
MNRSVKQNSLQVDKYSQLISDKGAKAIKWEKDDF